jgi:hypothetical protein
LVVAVVGSLDTDFAGSFGSDFAGSFGTDFADYMAAAVVVG